MRRRRGRNGAATGIPHKALPHHEITPAETCADRDAEIWEGKVPRRLRSTAAVERHGNLLSEEARGRRSRDESKMIPFIEEININQDYCTGIVTVALTY
jgi:hypothetical protein